ncbi:hypothetical protein J3A83DRAFT_4372544 [Scleroderma citrinum]
MRQRWPTEASYNPPSSGRPPATRQLNYTEGVLLEGPPRTQLPITEEIGRTTFTNDHSLIHVSGVDVDVSPSQGHSQTGGVTTQSRPHQGRVPLASIATTVASSGLERTSTGTNDPHFYSSPVAMEAPLALERVQPQPSATPTRIQRKQSRISVAKLEKSTSIGHWTDVLVKLPPPIPPRIRTRSHDVARNNRPSTILRSSQDSRGSGGTTYSAPPSTSSFSHLSNRFPSSEQITSDQRAYELPPVDVIDHTIQLDPLEEEPIAANNYVPGKPEPTPIPSHIHRADSLNTSSAHVLPQNVPRSLVTQPPVGYVHVPPDLAHSTIYPPQPSSATPISNQVRRLNHIIPRIVRRRRTDGSHHAAVSNTTFRVALTVLT